MFKTLRPQRISREKKKKKGRGTPIEFLTSFCIWKPRKKREGTPSPFKELLAYAPTLGYEKRGWKGKEGGGRKAIFYVTSASQLYGPCRGEGKGEKPIHADSLPPSPLMESFRKEKRKETA